MFAIPEDTLITENKMADTVIAVTEAVANQITAIHQRIWDTLRKDLSQTTKDEQTLRHETRTFMLLNCNGMERSDARVWEHIEAKASQVNADIVALTETHVKALDSKHREDLEGNWNISHPGWTIHHATNEMINRVVWPLFTKATYNTTPSGVSNPMDLPPKQQSIFKEDI